MSADILLYEELFALPAEEQARILAAAEEPEPVVLQTSCGWCGARMVEGALDVNGRESTGICPPCAATWKAKP
jgi:hypothetical protein